MTVTSLTSQVQYMNTVVGSQQVTGVSSIQPLSDRLVSAFHRPSPHPRPAAAAVGASELRVAK